MGILKVGRPSLETWKRPLGGRPKEQGERQRRKALLRKQGKSVCDISRSALPCPLVASMGHLCSLCEQVICKHEPEGHTKDCAVS